MNYLIFWGLLIGSFLLMEGMAWCIHRYIMHGFMWFWHKEHHQPPDRFLEKNDYFTLLFSLPSIIMLVLGYEVASLWFLKPMGYGILVYGFFYFVFHDLIVHRRIRFKFVAKNRYLRRIIRAHQIHHKTREREGAEAFGFLYAPQKYNPED